MNEYKTLQQLNTKTVVETYYTDSQDMLLFKEVAIMLNVENIAGTTPTLDVVIQHSMNNDDWADLHAFTQVVEATGMQFKNVPDGSDDGFARYLRAKVTIAGTGPQYTFEVTMVGKE